MELVFCRNGMLIEKKKAEQIEQKIGDRYKTYVLPTPSRPCSFMASMIMASLDNEWETTWSHHTQVCRQCFKIDSCVGTIERAKEMLVHHRQEKWNRWATLELFLPAAKPLRWVGRWGRSSHSMGMKERSFAWKPIYNIMCEWAITASFYLLIFIIYVNNR